MVVLNYFEIITDFHRWFSNHQVNICRRFYELEEALSNQHQKIAGTIMIRSFEVGITREDIFAVLDFTELLEMKILVSSSINHLFDSNTFDLGSKYVFEAFNKLKNRIQTYQEDLSKQIQKFSIYEKKRINEAFHSTRDWCYFSVVINSVVALEYRLLELLKRENEPYLASINADFRFTFGQLIGIYLNNSSQFNNIIPKKFDNLLKLCNSYRIFSAHAKDEEVNANDAKAVLNLTLSFLLDDRCKL